MNGLRDGEAVASERGAVGGGVGRRVGPVPLLIGLRDGKGEDSVGRGVVGAVGRGFGPSPLMTGP